MDSGVLQVHYTFGTGFWGDVKQVGNYQNIVLTPVTREYVDCVNRDDVDIEYYVEKKVDITDSPWYKDNVINDYEALSDPVNLTSWEKPANFSFEADKGDKLVLRLKTDTPNLKITLDGVEQPLPEIFYQDEELSCENINPNRYYDYEVAILSTGKHTFEITYLGKDTFSFPYIYLEDLKILKPIQVEEVTEDEYTLEVKTCPNGYQVKDYHGERNDETAGGVVDGNAADKVDTPNTMDNVLIFVLTMGIGICLTGWSLILRRKIVSSNK